MKVNNISLTNFRNYEQQEFDFRDGINVICGKNAQGKTNLLESVYLLSTAKSFRTQHKKELVKFDRDICSVTANAISSDREYEIKSVISKNAPPIFKINGIKCKKSADVSGILNSVMFGPEDLEIVRGAAAARRKFADTALCQLRPSYSDALTKYNKFTENKCRILRDGADNPALYDILDDFSEGMIKLGAYIIKRRREFLDFISKEACDIHCGFSNGKETLSVQYHTVSGVDDFSDISEIELAVRKNMMLHKSHEIASKQCLCGPHRDDFDVLINGINARSFGSQGQTRSAAISLKLAERKIFYKDTGEYPLLLLDDVLSELDAGRQKFILNNISEGQVFVTCCDEEQVSNVPAEALFNINEGRLV